MEPIAQVSKIENGFLLEVHSHAGEVRQVYYAKDAKGIAEEIISLAAREVLGIPAQTEMFTPAQMGTKPKGK